MTTSARTGDVAATVAVRGAWWMSAISPKKSPPSSEFTFLPVLDDVGGALDEHEELAAGRALAGQLLALLEVDLVRDAADQGQLLLGAFGEQRRA